ncbi:MAG: phosphatidylserine decarboxylase family protein [Mucinivorans sp.]
MKIHKEGYIIILCFVLLALVLALLTYWLIPVMGLTMAIVGLVVVAFVVRFFRSPHRYMPQADDKVIYSPADGTIVALEEVFQEEYLGCRTLKISIFMSVWNVHINWFPVSGEVLYFKHHQGRYLVAWHEKSSTLNERTTTVVDTGTHVVLFRQIAGFVARRIVNRTQVGSRVSQCSECGFIKFGSRVDLYLPLGTEPTVKIGEKVVGTQTIIAKLK